MLGIARIPTHASDVPTDSLIEKPIHSANAGTITIPPPTPSRPLSPPAPSAVTATLPSSPRPRCSPPSGTASGTGDSGSSRAATMRHAVNPTRPAVAIMRRWPSPGTTCDRSAPPTAAADPIRPTRSTTDHRTRPSRW